MIIAVPVPTTNAPVRVWVQIEIPAAGLRAFVRRMVDLTGKASGEWGLRGPVQYFTNETVVAIAPGAP